MHSAHGRVAVGAVIGAVTAAVFAIGALNGGQGYRPTPDDRAAVEPVPPDGRPTEANAPLPTRSSRTSSSRTSTATSTTTTTGTTTTTTRRDAPADPVTTTTEEQPPPPPPTNDPPTTTTTRCHSLICVG
jgi:hypothetical protein